MSRIERAALRSTLDVAPRAAAQTTSPPGTLPNRAVPSSGFANTVRLTNAAPRNTEVGPPVIVSGNSNAGLLSAAALASQGFRVHLVAPHTDYVRNPRVFVREAILNELAHRSPELLKAVLAEATPLNEYPYRRLRLGEGKSFVDLDLDRLGDDEYRKELRKKGITVGARHEKYAPDPEKRVDLPTDVMSSEYTHVIPLRRFEMAVANWVKNNTPGEILFHQGMLVPEPSAEVPFKVALSDVQADFLQGETPVAVVLAEGAGSSSLKALGVESAPTTPPQTFLSGVVHDDVQAPDARVNLVTGRMKNNFPLLESGTSDGKGVTWITRTFDLKGRQPEDVPYSEILSEFLITAERLTGIPQEELQARGIEGALGIPGSVPGLFESQGVVARKAALVMPNGTVVVAMGDGVHKSHHNLGGGLNTAVGEVAAIEKMGRELKAGVDPEVVAQHANEQILPLGDEWGAKALFSYFQRFQDPVDNQRMEQRWRMCVQDYRDLGAPSPLDRLRATYTGERFAQQPKPVI